MKDTKMVLGLTHIDLGWIKGRTEMAQILDAYLIQLFDILERHPNFYYLLEQALHYRDLKMRRPDLFEKLKHYVGQGNLEFATPLVSTIENNLTNGESLVRNMQLGAEWIEAEFGVRVKTCMMIDTFGFPPQMPQVLRQFGYRELFANRLGGRKMHDVFLCTGLDGSELLIAGRDTQTSYTKPGHIVYQYYKDRHTLETLFERAQQNKIRPLLVMPYTENETPPDPYIIELMEQRYAGQYRYATLSEFWRQLDQANKDWPRETADLNPEFSGTFSLRHCLKEHNRKTERLLLQAEQLCALTGERRYDQKLKDAWWEMAYLQFHDILTGSHPTAVYLDCLERFAQIEADVKTITENVIKRCGEEILEEDRAVYTVYNDLPWTRKQSLCLELKEGWTGVQTVLQDGTELPCCIQANKVCFDVTVAPLSSAAVELVRSQNCVKWADAPMERLENDTLLIEFGKDTMIRKILHKPTSAVLLENCDDLLVLQRDWGSYQIEAPAGAEIPCGAGEYHTELTQGFHCQQAVIEGFIPAWDGRQVNYRLTLVLPDNQPYLDLTVDVDWQVSAARLRLNLPTVLGATENYYEVPFGVANRNPYSQTETAKGEWAAHRFVAMDNETKNLGVALANTGCAGTETANGTLKTTLLRSPHATLAGMIPDDTSGDPGHHAFRFRMLAYQGSWKQSGILRYAQELNSPCLVVPGTKAALPSAFAIDVSNIVLSSIKNAGDDLIAVRMYESAGLQTDMVLKVKGIEQAWASDLQEIPQGVLPHRGDGITLSFAPFEIKTILVRRN